MSNYTKGLWEVEIVKSGKDEVYARIKGKNIQTKEGVSSHTA